MINMSFPALEFYCCFWKWCFGKQETVVFWSYRYTDVDVHVDMDICTRY